MLAWMCATTFSITTLSIKTRSIMDLMVTLSIATLSMTVECHYVECRIFLLLCWTSSCWVTLRWASLRWMSICWGSWGCMNVPLMKCLFTFTFFALFWIFFSWRYFRKGAIFVVPLQVTGAYPRVEHLIGASLGSARILEIWLKCFTTVLTEYNHLIFQLDWAIEIGLERACFFVLVNFFPRLNMQKLADYRPQQH